MSTEDEAVVLINAFKVPADADAAFVRGWRRARDYMATREGYLSSALHRSVSPGADFRYVNVARWRNVEAFRAAVESPGFRQAADLPYPNHPALYEIVD